MDKQTLPTTKLELERLLTEERGLLHSLEFKAATRQLTKVRQIRAAKRKIAKIMTALRNAV